MLQAWKYFMKGLDESLQYFKLTVEAQSIEFPAKPMTALIFPSPPSKLSSHLLNIAAARARGLAGRQR